MAEKKKSVPLDMVAAKRLMGYIYKPHKKAIVLVLIGIVVSSLASVIGSLFIQTLIDQYITPLIGQSNPNFGPLVGAIAQMALIYYIGAAANLLYNRSMVTIAQGVLKEIRDEMFAKMQELPIS